MSSTKIILLMVVVCMAVSSVSAIKCYSCLTGCNDPYTGETTHEASDCSYCSKFKVKSSDNQAVIRACVSSGSQDDKCENGSNDGVEGDICYCSTDLCNGSGVPVISLFALVAVVAMKFML